LASALQTSREFVLDSPVTKTRVRLLSRPSSNDWNIRDQADDF
jgi:hypothetical protein